jgi:fimbrial chaperone protein
MALRAVIITAVVLGAIHFPIFCSGQEWSVSPIRLEFASEKASGVITISNNSAKRLNCQMKAFRWTQDEEGKDRYTETRDIIFFPRLMVIEPKDRKVIRVGTKVSASQAEQTYRLFVEDVTPSQSGEGANVVFAIRFGVPIFLKPFKEKTEGVIERIAMDKGVIEVTVKNTGNSHFIIQKITVRAVGPGSEAILSKDLPGWYLLSGSVKNHTMEIPRESCRKIARVEIEVKTDKFTLKDDLNVQKTMCSR